MAKFSEKQERVIRFVKANPGCCKMDVCRSEWGGKGHKASYDRVMRLLRRKALRIGTPATPGHGRVGLYVA